jgi:hypothetical protein
MSVSHLRPVKGTVDAWSRMQHGGSWRNQTFNLGIMNDRLWVESFCCRMADRMSAFRLLPSVTRKFEGLRLPLNDMQTHLKMGTERACILPG